MVPLNAHTYAEGNRVTILSYPKFYRDGRNEWAETDPRWTQAPSGLLRLTGAPYGASYNPATGEIALETGGKRRTLRFASIGARRADNALLASMPLAKDVRKVGTDALDLAAVSGITPRIIAGPDQLRIVADVSDATDLLVKGANGETAYAAIYGYPA